jgi:ornithine--oxo-acid transaminase
VKGKQAVMEVSEISSVEPYAAHVNPEWVRLLHLLQMDAQYVRCEGTELITATGRRILDYLSGYCVHNAGHNHPAIVAALHEELRRNGPAMLQSHIPDLAGELASRLCAMAGRNLTKAFFACSGSEAVESAIKFARATTGRNGLLFAKGAFHGLTCGALSLMGECFWSEGFGPMLPDTHGVAFNDLTALGEQLRTQKYAAFFVEPIQSEAGIRLPDEDYLRHAKELCARTGTLFVLDEVQTGMFRTGPFLAALRYRVEPDMIILAKALSGGLVPCSAVLMTEDVYRSVYGSLKRAIIHTSTFSENSLSMRAGLATLDVLQNEDLGLRAIEMGRLLRSRLRESLAGYEMVRDIRGEGLLCGIEFQAPRHVRLRVPFEAFRHIHSGMFGQVVVMRMYREHGILTQICGNDFMVLKAAPPLVVTESEIERFVFAAREVIECMHSSPAFWSEALGMARRAVNF